MTKCCEHPVADVQQGPDKLLLREIIRTLEQSIVE